MSAASSPRLSVPDHLRVALVGLRTRRLRAALSALGIAAGIATLVLIVSISDASNAGVHARLDALGANLILAQAEAQGNTTTRFVRDAQAMTLRIGPVTAAAAVAALPQVVRRNPLIDANDVTGLNAYAATPTLTAVLHAHMLAGGFLTHRTAEMREAVIGNAAAANLGISPQTLDEHPQIEIGHTLFTVAGIMDPMPVTSGLDYGVFVGWSTAASILNFNGRATAVYLRAGEKSIPAVSQVLGPTLLPQAPGLVNVSQPTTALAAQQAVSSAASSLVLGLVGVALVVGGIGIANTMYVAVIERRREIGLRRALGATRQQIRAQFLLEAVLLAGAGSLLGVAAGLLGAAGDSVAQGLPVVFSPGAVIGGLLGGLIVGAIAGLYPATRAARLTPTEALATG